MFSFSVLIRDKILTLSNKINEIYGTIQQNVVSLVKRSFVHVGLKSRDTIY